MRRFLKHLQYRCACLAVLPRRLMLWLGSLWLDRDQAFSRASESLANIAGGWGLAVREAFYRKTLDHVGSDVHFGYGTLLSKRDAWIGDRVYLGRYCIVGRVTIESDCLIADHVQLLSGRHHHSDTALRVESIRLGRGCWVGGGAVVMSDLGEGTIIGAGAVVLHATRPGSVNGGVPAKMLRRNRKEAA